MRTIALALIFGLSCICSSAIAADPYHFLYIVGLDVGPSTIFPGINFESGVDSKNAPPARKEGGRLDVREEHYRNFMNSLETNKSRSFSLMLFCRELTDEEQKLIPRLYSAFHSFSHSIGEANTAVWIGSQRPPTFDLKVGKDFCDGFQLDYNKGPYLLYYRIDKASLTSSESSVQYLPGMYLETKHIVMDFDRISIERIPVLLNSLERYIRNGLEMNKIRGPLAFEQATQWLISFGEKYMDKIVGAVKKGKVSFELKWLTMS